jgi:hypothetical protein
MADAAFPRGLRRSGRGRRGGGGRMGARVLRLVVWVRTDLKWCFMMLLACGFVRVREGCGVASGGWHTLACVRRGRSGLIAPSGLMWPRGPAAERVGASGGWWGRPALHLGRAFCKSDAPSRGVCFSRERKKGKFSGCRYLSPSISLGSFCCGESSVQAGGNLRWFRSTAGGDGRGAHVAAWRNRARAPELN